MTVADAMQLRRLRNSAAPPELGSSVSDAREVAAWAPRDIAQWYLYVVNEEQAVIVYIPANAPNAYSRCHEWEEALAEVIARAGLGEVDGAEVGEGWIKVFVYGHDAAALARAIVSTVRGGFPEGAYIMVRRGPPGSYEEPVWLSPEPQA